MFKFVLLFLTLSGLHAAPIAAPEGLQRSAFRLPDGFRRGPELSGFLRDGFRQGTEPSRRFIVDLNTGRVQEHLSEMDRRAVPADVPVKRTGESWVRVEEPSVYDLPEGFRQGTERVQSIPHGFRQGTEPSMPIQESSRQGSEHVQSIPDGFRQGTEPQMVNPAGFRQGTKPRVSLSDVLRLKINSLRTLPAGFRQGTERSLQIPEGFRQGSERSLQILEDFRQGTERFHIPEGFRQGTERSPQIPEGFRQGTERSLQIPEGFRQGTERSQQVPNNFRQGTERFHIPEGFRQGTERSLQIPQGFRQGTERSLQIAEGFRQGTERSQQVPDNFRQGTEPLGSVPEGFRQGTEPSRIKTQTAACMGEIINGNCYEFHRTPLTFHEAQIRCRALAPSAELASVTSGDLHSRLVSLVTGGGQRSPVLTWLGATVKGQQASWVDGSEWSYSDWMPGHPNVHKPACAEMFKIDERWWTAADCDLKRASICSYPLAA